MHAQPSPIFNLFVPHPPGWDSGSYFFVTGPGQRGEEGSFFGFWVEEKRWTAGKQGGAGWAARLTGWWGCHWGRRCRDVQGVGVCGSNDKHQWEYEMLDGNLSQEVRLYHCRRNHRREADLVRLCSAALGQAPNLLQTGRYSVIVLPCLKTKSTHYILCADHRKVVLNLCVFSILHHSPKTHS